MTKIKGAVGLAISDAIAKAISFALVPYLAVQLSVAEFGKLTLSLTFVQVAVVFISSSAQSLIPIQYVKHGDGAAAQTWHASARVSLIVAIALAALSPLLIVTKTDVDPVFWLLIIWVAFGQARNMVNISLLRISQNYVNAAIGQLAYAVFSTISTIAVFSLIDASVSVRLLCLAITCELVNIGHHIVIRREFSSKNAEAGSIVDEMKQVLYYGKGLLLHHLSYWLRSSLDRLFIASLLTLEALGLYGAAFQAASAFTLLTSIASQALQPYLYSMINLKDRKSYEKILLRACAITTGLAALYTFAMLAAFPHLFGEKYAQATGAFAALAIASLFQSLYYYFSHMIFFHKKNHVVSRINAIATLMHATQLLVLMLFFRAYASPLVVAFCSALTAALALAATFFSERKIANEEMF